MYGHTSTFFFFFHIVHIKKRTRAVVGDIEHNSDRKHVTHSEEDGIRQGWATSNRVFMSLVSFSHE